MKRMTLMGMLMCGLLVAASAESRIGFQVQVYVEPNEERSLYVNVLPAMYEFSLGDRVSAKLGSVVGLRIGDGVSIGNVGLSATIPTYFGGQPRHLDGFYVGPNAIVTYNFATSDLVVTGDVEAGYSFYSGEAVSWVFGMQFGASAFFGNGRTEVLSHWGPQAQIFLW